MIPEIRRGEVWWLDLPETAGSEPAGSRPVVVLQSDSFNRSRLATAIVASLTGNLRRAEAPGNVLLLARESGLPEDSVVNVSQILTTDKTFLRDRAGSLPPEKLKAVERGVALALALRLAD